MGWTSKNYSDCEHNEWGLNNCHIERFLEQEILHHPFKCIAATCQPDALQHELYLKIENTKTNVKFILVVLVQIQNGEIAWKEISEDMGPSYVRCPTSFFDIPEAGGYSAKWRSDCVEYWKRNGISVG